MRVGTVGLGLLGSGITKRLIDSGHRISVFNQRNQRLSNFQVKTNVTSSPRELADTCDLVITVVTDFDALKEVLFGRNGVIESHNRRLVVANAGPNFTIAVGPLC